MSLTNPAFASNARLQRAAENSPPMRRGEPDREAVAILQRSLIGIGVTTMRRSLRADGSLDGVYGGETVEAVRRFQQRVGLVDRHGNGDGIVGRDTMLALDRAAPQTPVRPTVAAGDGEHPHAETPETTAPPAGMRVPLTSRLYAAYRTFSAVSGQVCRRSGQDPNQCAVRMSVALGMSDCGFDFSRWRLGFIHSGRGHCTDGEAIPPHVTSATNLTDYLAALGMVFELYPRLGRLAVPAQRVIDRLRGRSGIVFFPQLDGRRLSHIDFWNGSVVMNEELNYRASDEPPDSADYFRRAHGTIRFCPTR